MNIKTKFNVGDNVCTIDKKTMKIKKFEIGNIFIFAAKNGRVDVTYRAVNDSYNSDSYEEEKCFTSEAELMTFITAPVEQEVK